LLKVHISFYATLTPLQSAKQIHTRGVGGRKPILEYFPTGLEFFNLTFSHTGIFKSLRHGKKGIHLLQKGSHFT
jgi:hypothetical protein